MGGKNCDCPEFSRNTSAQKVLSLNLASPQTLMQVINSSALQGPAVLFDLIQQERNVADTYALCSV